MSCGKLPSLIRFGEKTDGHYICIDKTQTAMKRFTSVLATALIAAELNGLVSDDREAVLIGHSAGGLKIY